MRLNKENGRILGVCAGIADYLDFPAAPIRVIFVVCVLLWPPVIVAYFLAYLCLDRDFSSSELGEYFRNGKTAEHFRNLNYRRPIYKNLRDRRFAGVCAGIADYFDVSPFAVRIVAIASVFILGPYVFLAYFICMFVLEADPHQTGQVNSRFQQRRERKRERRLQRRERHRQKYEHRMTRRRGRYDPGPTDADIDTNYTSPLEAAFQDLERQPTDSASENVANFARRSASRQECAALYNSLELRLREIEAFITSKQFRLHCEINRI